MAFWSRLASGLAGDEHGDCLRQSTKSKTTSSICLQVIFFCVGGGGAGRRVLYGRGGGFIVG